MKKIPLSEIPADYHYYRSHTRSFSQYITEKEEKGVIPVLENGYFGYIRHYFFGLFSLARFEKSDTEPTRELLRKYGMKRGLVLWSPWHKTSIKSSYWIRFGYLISHFFHHSTRSAFSVLDTPEYWRKWQPNARNHRNKIQKWIEDGKISMSTCASWEAFRDVYKNIRVPHAHRRYFIWRQEFFMKKNPDDFRIFLASVDGIPLAGAIFLDDHPTSTYLIAFQHPDAKRYHLGLAILDRWFSDSQKSGYQFLDLDHMQDVLDKQSYAGYTRFKSEIADYEVRFWRVWMKIFF